jgi:hypothetical protein
LHVLLQKSYAWTPYAPLVVFADDVPRITEDIIQEAILTRGPRYADREFFCQWSADDDAFLPPNMVDSIFELAS